MPDKPKSTSFSSTNVVYSTELGGGGGAKPEHVTVDVGSLAEKFERLEKLLAEHGIHAKDGRGRAETAGGTGMGTQTLSKVGEPFNPGDRNQELHGENQRVLPRNVYSAAILAHVNGDDAGQAILYGVLATGPPVVVTLVAQVTLGYYLFGGVTSADGDLAPECAPDLYYLQCAALTAFVCMAMRDFLEALDTHQWLQMFKRSAGHEELKLQKYKDQNDDTLHRPTTGLTRCARTAFYLLLLLPCVAVTTLVLIAGSGAVLRSENRFDLVLNCVAAIFVLDLDDICYALLVSRSAKNACEGLPPLNAGEEEGGEGAAFGRFCGAAFFFWLVFGAALLIDVPLYNAWCVLPFPPDAANASANASALNGTSWS